MGECCIAKPYQVKRVVANYLFYQFRCDFKFHFLLKPKCI